MSADERLHDALETVLLDRAGVIVAANQAWLDFALANGGDPGLTGIGASYLAVCYAAGGDPGAHQVADAVRAALRGDLPAPVRIRITCHAPGTRRWFDVFVSSRHDDWGDCIGATVTLAPAPDAGRLVTVVREAWDGSGTVGCHDETESYRVAFERAPIGMALMRIDERGGRTVLRANQALADLFGEALDRLIGADLDAYSTADNRAHDRRTVAALLSGELRSYSRHKCYRRVDGRRVWAEVRVTRVDVPGVEGANTLGHFVDVTERHEAEQRRARRAELDAAVAEIATSVLAGTPLPAVYRLVADVTARVFEAENVALGLPDARDGALTAVATIGPASGELLVLAAPGTRPCPSTSGSSGSSRATSGTPPGPLGPVATARFGRPGPDGGLVAVARPDGGDLFGEADLTLLVSLAQQVALAVELGRARADQQRLAVLEDRQRIARDLHDTVIQDLIAVGMQLDTEVTKESGRDPGRARRDGALVDQLEEAVRRLRGSVFELREPGRRTALADTVTGVVAEASRMLGHRPTIRTSGDVTAVPGPVADAVVAVLREALSNVARHARASATDVDLVVGRHDLSLTVTDDGRGLPADLVPGDGIANVRHRAEALLGTAAVTSGSAGGTCLSWRCPL